MDERFFATAAVALLLALAFGTGSSRQSSRGEPVQSARVASDKEPGSPVPVIESGVSRTVPIVRVEASPRT